MSQRYFYPGLISLENIDFEKLDILPGTAKFAVADFAILNAGSIYDLSITVDRDGQNLIKSCSDLVFSESGFETKFAEDVAGTSSITGILDNGLTLSNLIMNSNIVNPSNDFENTLKGIIFVKMVTSIFNMTDESLRNIDFTLQANRNGSVTSKFFDNDETLDVVNNIKLKTIGLDSSGNGDDTDDSGNIVYFDSAFNQTITEWNVGVSGEVILNSEVEYWNARTGQDISGNHTETEHIYFNPDDKLMVMYSISTTFTQSSHDSVGSYRTSVDNLSAFRTSDNVFEDTMELIPGIGNLNFDSRFILEYNVNPITNYLTGHNFEDDGGVTLNTAVAAWFSDATSAEGTYGHISTWDTSEVKDFSSLFWNKSNFNEDLSHWNVSNVTDMSAMFRNASSFNQNISSWNVSKVTNMYRMFQGASAFNSDISNWDVSKVEDMEYMFASTESFNSNLNNWNVSSVKNMYAMFTLAHFDQDISDWDTSAVTSMRMMFYYSHFNQPLNDWRVDQVEDMSFMFGNTASFNQPLNPPPIGGWEVGNVTTMVGMFFQASAFYQDISNWNTTRSSGYGLAAGSMYTGSAIENKNSYKAPNT